MRKLGKILKVQIRVSTVFCAGVVGAATRILSGSLSRQLRDPDDRYNTMAFVSPGRLSFLFFSLFTFCKSGIFSFRSATFIDLL